MAETSSPLPLGPEMDPGGCLTPDDVAEYLCNLRLRAGNISFREITRLINVDREQRGIVHNTSSSTVNDCFQPGRKRFDRDLVLGIAAVLGLDAVGLLRLEQVCLVISGHAAERSIVDVQNTTPPRRPQFTGRVIEMRMITDYIEDARVNGLPPVYAIDGMPGIGKTQMAVQVAHRLVSAGYCPDGQCFVDLHGFDPDRDPTPPDDVLSTLLKLLNVPEGTIAAARTTDAKSQLFRRHMAGRRALLILDNAANAEQVRPLLPHSPQCLVLITSRCRSAAAGLARSLTLPALGVQDGMDLLRRFDPRHRIDDNPETSSWLVERLCYGRPLDLVALGGQLANPSESQWTMIDFAARLARLPNDENSRPALAGTYQSLSPQVRRVFRLLALIRDAEFSSDDVAVLADLDPGEAEDALDLLFDRHLLEQRRPGRFRFHDVIFAFADDRLNREEPATEQHDALRRLRTAATRAMTPQMAVHAISRVPGVYPAKMD